MKIKVFIALLILLFSIPTNADINVMVVGGKVESSDCSSGTYELGYDGDHSSGSDYTCYDSGADDEQGTTVDATVTSSYVEYSSVNDHLKWTVTGDISASMDEQGTIFFDFFSVNDSTWTKSSLIELHYDANNVINCKVDGANSRVMCYHEGNSSTQNLLLTGRSVATWTRCGYTWDTTANTHAGRCVESGSVDLSVPDNEDSETLTPFDNAGAVDPTTFVIGEDVSGAEVEDTTRVRNVYIVSGYKATDPGSL